MGVKIHPEHASNNTAIEDSDISLRNYRPAIERITRGLVTEEKH